MLDAPALPGTRGGCFAIRCRCRSPASTGELTDWLRARVAELREEAPRLQVRLTRVAGDPAAAGDDDGWLIEAELPGGEATEVLGSLAAALGEILRDMRILGLDPRVLAPVGVPPPRDLASRPASRP